MMENKHTYCFYMANGEHIMVDAEEMDVLDDCVLLKRNGQMIIAKGERAWRRL